MWNNHLVMAFFRSSFAMQSIFVEIFQLSSCRCNILRVFVDLFPKNNPRAAIKLGELWQST